MGFKRVVFIFKKYIYSTLLWTPPPLSFPPPFKVYNHGHSALASVLLTPLP